MNTPIDGEFDYQSFRDELVKLLERGATLLPAVEEQGRDLRTIREKLLGGQFTITLVSGFQCGKSTTFDTLCDGRALSPIGFGSKTSGCLVFGQNLGDRDKPEYADVVWRHKRELIEGFYCDELPSFRDKTSKLDLDRAEDLQRLREAAEAEYKRWENPLARASYDPEGVGLLDVVRCALLVARFYGEPGLVELRRREDWKPEDLSRFIRFPSKWNDRWMTKGVEAFTWEECTFLFIASARLHLHSDNLERTGSVILDCPGLFASKWDSEVARQAMEKADAILYLVSGERTINASDVGQLKKLHDSGMGYKLFYAFNMWKSLATSRDDLVPETKAILKGNGVDATNVEFFLVHADLALRALQAERLLAGSLDSFTREETLRVLGRRNEQGVLADTIEKFLLRRLQQWHSNLDVSDERPELNEHGVVLAKRASQLPVLLREVEKYVTTHKAETVLIQNGADHVVRTLTRKEGELVNAEEAARKNKEEQAQQLEREDVRLKAFEGECSRFLERIRGEDAQAADYKLAEDFCETLDENWFGSVAEAAARKINREIMKPYFSSLRDHDEIKRHMRDIIGGALEEALQNRFSAWWEQIKRGKNRIYNDRLRGEVLRIQGDMNEAWEGVCTEKMSVVDKVQLVQLTGDFVRDLQIAATEFKAGDLSVTLDIAGLTRDIIRDEGFLGYLWAGIKDLADFLFGWLIDLVKGIFGSPAADRESEVKQKVVRALTSPQCQEVLKGRLKPKLQLNVAKIRAWYGKILTANFEIPRKAFNRNKAERQRLLCLAAEDLKRVAEDAKAYREEKIAPLRREVQSFVTRCRAALPKSP